MGSQLVGLPPGDYTLTAEHDGFAKFVRRGIVVLAGLNLRLDITLKIGSLTETIEVPAATPMLEADTAVQAINIDGDFQRRLPLSSRRDWSDFLELSPGVVGWHIDPNVSGPAYMVRGSDLDGHVLLIDGADLGSFFQSASSYIGFNTDAIADAQVKTGAVDASTPLGIGAVVNVTRSGTNQVRGTAATVYKPLRWNGTNNPNGTVATDTLFQPDLSIGGPVLGNHTWFYGAYRYTRREVGISRSEKQMRDLRALVPGFRPFDNRSRLHFYYLKVTAQLSPRHQMYVFAQRDLNPQESNSAIDGGRFQAFARGGPAYAARISSMWNDSLTTRVLASFNAKSSNPDPGIFGSYVGEGASRLVHERVFSSAGRLVGTGVIARLDNFPFRGLVPSSKATLQADLTYYRSGWLGSHDLQIGGYLQPRLRTETRNTFVNGGFAIEEVVLRQAADPAAGFVPFQRVVYDAASVTQSSLAARDYAFYLQDAWKPWPSLTIQAGVRLDWIGVTDRLFRVTTQESLDAGPRLGATYTVTKDRHNIVRASWVRVHDMPQSLSLPSAGTNQVGLRDLYDLDLDGEFETVFVTPPTLAVTRGREIDPRRHQGHIDEWILGYRRQLPSQISLDASFVRRNYEDRPALIEVNGIYDGGIFRGYRDEASNQIFRVTNNTHNWFVYSALEVTATKRSPRIQALGTFTHAFQHLGGTWQPNDPASFLQPKAFPNDRGLGYWRAQETDSLSLFLAHSQPWRRDILRGGLSYLGPWHLVLSTTYTLQSGSYSGPILTRIAAPDPGYGPPTIRLSNGRLVSNPLATTIRFAFGTRGEGQIMAPAVRVWNLRLGRDFRFGDRCRLETAFDIFNVVNDRVDQSFRFGGNHLFSPDYAAGPAGEFRGLHRQTPRAAQASIRWVF